MFWMKEPRFQNSAQAAVTNLNWLGVQQAIGAYMAGCRTLAKVRYKITIHVPVE
jgi:hypothetical protein